MLVQVANTAQQEEIQMHRLRVRICVPRVVTVEVAYLNVLQEGMETFQAPVVLTSALLDVIVTILLGQLLFYLVAQIYACLVNSEIK